MYLNLSSPIRRYRMCFREACITRLTQAGPFGLGDPSDNGDSSETITGVAVDTDCINYKNRGQTPKAYIAIDNVRFCGSRFLRVHETSELSDSEI